MRGNNRHEEAPGVLRQRENVGAHKPGSGKRGNITEASWQSRTLEVEAEPGKWYGHYSMPEGMRKKH